MTIPQDLRTAAQAIIDAWEFDEIGQIEGELIEALQSALASLPPGGPPCDSCKAGPDEPHEGYCRHAAGDAGEPVAPDLPEINMPVAEAIHYWRTAARQNWEACNRLLAKIDALNATPSQGADALDARRYRRLRGIYMSLMCSHIGMKPIVRFMKNLEHPDFTPEMLDAVVDVADGAIHD